MPSGMSIKSPSAPGNPALDAILQASHVGRTRLVSETTKTTTSSIGPMPTIDANISDSRHGRAGGRTVALISILPDLAAERRYNGQQRRDARPAKTQAAKPRRVRHGKQSDKADDDRRLHQDLLA